MQITEIFPVSNCTAWPSSPLRKPVTKPRCESRARNVSPHFSVFHGCIGIVDDDAIVRQMLCCAFTLEADLPDAGRRKKGETR